MKIGFCFLAYGDDYVREFLQIAPNFPKEDIIVTSDRQIEDYNTIIVNVLNVSHCYCFFIF